MVDANECKNKKDLEQCLGLSFDLFEKLHDVTHVTVEPGDKRRADAYGRIRTDKHTEGHHQAEVTGLVMRCRCNPAVLVRLYLP